MKSDEEFLNGIYKKAEQKRLEAMEQEKRRPNSFPFHFHAWKKVAAACILFVATLAIYNGNKKESTESDNHDSEIAMTNLTGLPVGEETPDQETGNIAGNGRSSGPLEARGIKQMVSVVGTIRSVPRQSASDGVALLSEETLLLETVKGVSLEVFVLCGGEFSKGEEVALCLVFEDNKYYLTDFNQKYVKNEDDLYYNVEGMLFLEDEGGE